jgi:agmatine deiminase
MAAQVFPCADREQSSVAAQRDQIFHRPAAARCRIASQAAVRIAAPMDLLAKQGPTRPVPDDPQWGDRRDAGDRRGATRLLHHRALWAIGLFLLALLLFFGGWSLGRFKAPPTSGIRGVLSGEFQTCQGLLLAPPPDYSQPRLDVFLDVIAHARKYVQVQVLVRDAAHRRALVDQLRRVNVAENEVRFLQVPFANPWVRDYGPFVVASFGQGYEMLDFDYAMRRIEPAWQRSLDDAVPSEVAAVMGAQAIKVRLALDGGNLLSNGAGLCLTTSASCAANPDRTREEICEIVREYLGGQQLVMLEPLLSETTGHVDMFCTFTASDTVVIAACNPQTDPENAALLDRNAQRLAELRTNCGPLKVVRIPMPTGHKSRDQKLIAFSYTNVIYANGLLLVPSYQGVAADVEEQVLATYRRLLPNWSVVSINSTPILQKEGSLHCIALNLEGIVEGLSSPR